MLLSLTFRKWASIQFLPVFSHILITNFFLNYIGLRGKVMVFASFSFHLFLKQNSTQNSATHVFGYWFCKHFVIIQHFHFISVISFWILRGIFHICSNTGLPHLIFTRQFILRTQAVFISDFTSDRPLTAAWMVLPRGTMGSMWMQQEWGT